MLRNVGLRGTDDALLLSETDGVLRRIGILTSFHLHKYENIALPADHIDFTAFGAISRTHDSITDRTQIMDSVDFGTAAKC